MKVLPSLIFLIALTAFSSACAANRISLRPNDATEGAIVLENKSDGMLYVIVKSQVALNAALSKLQCKKQPCMIGRIGELYMVERPKTD